MHGLSPFLNNFAIKFLKNSICPRSSVNGDIKKKILSFLKYLHFESFFCGITVFV